MKGLNGTFPVTIVDEAHLLSKEMLEEIRFLLNFKMDPENPMALILSGQSELWNKLKLQSYAAIRQRIDIFCVVIRLDRSKTNEYISSISPFPVPIEKCLPKLLLMKYSSFQAAFHAL
ncbi:MAG: AAA family ATPase [Defluviitaleaceae bacterium]|nr:AAA family ATPase [Defluviitaleaceae bacterium]